MLTVQQADIVSLLKDFKCLRSAHVRQYIAAKHHAASGHLDKMLTQLSFLGKIRIIDGYVMLPGRKKNDGVIKAFDVMMDLTQGQVDYLYPGAGPFTLTFSVQSGTGDYHHYGVVIVDRNFENSICKRLHIIDREMTVIFILNDFEQQRKIKIQNQCYFAIPNEKGKYKFFKAAYKPQR